MGIGEKRETFILTSPGAAYTLANEIKADHNIHIASTTYHKAADTTNTITSSDASTLATLYALANELKTDFNTHELSTTYHRAGGVNIIASPDAISIGTAYALLNELKIEYNLHIASVTYHIVGDTSNPVTSPSSTLAAINKDFNADGGSVLVELTGADSWDGTVDFQTTLDGVTFYNIPYVSRSTITPTPTVAQISSPSTAAIYLLLAPLSQIRIACVTGTVGSLTVVYRTINPSDLNVCYLVAGTNAIGKLAANSGVDIGDVDVTSIVPGTAATNLGKAEDAAHASGDSGVLLLAVRKDAAAILAGTDGDYVPLIVDAYGRLHVAPIVSAIHTEYPFGKGDLTSNGTQWSATTDTTTANVDVTIESAMTIEPPESGAIVEVEFGLTGGFRAVSSATADIIYKWQARDKDGTWVTLVTVTKTNIGATEVEETYSGRFATVANFDAVPFDVQLVIQCNETNEGRARIKNSSYVRVKYNPS